MKRLILTFLPVALLGVGLQACKQEPEYQLKEPFGLNTMSAVDEGDLDPDIIRIPKKNFDRGKWEENQRHKRAIKKILKQARDWDPKYN